MLKICPCCKYRFLTAVSRHDSNKESPDYPLHGALWHLSLVCPVCGISEDTTILERNIRNEITTKAMHFNFMIDAMKKRIIVNDCL